MNVNCRDTTGVRLRVINVCKLRTICHLHWTKQLVIVTVFCSVMVINTNSDQVTLLTASKVSLQRVLPDYVFFVQTLFGT